MATLYMQNYNKNKSRTHIPLSPSLSKFGTSSSTCTYAPIFATFKENGTAFGATILSAVRVVWTSNCAVFKLSVLCVISGFLREITENCALLRYYTVDTRCVII
jgi:hypothetical protein